ncbi:hypothetical protein EYZ11_005644 [Aspergillus tanneri]|uniref:Uncharacterized protein n=1 Tax=Aspergillus tanneri TaxID=1220188 RepID=A0A4S3JHR3_9EURO|nr:hypothetical protein EYZ11_005644 [Aspergillus tanneri]
MRLAEEQLSESGFVRPEESILRRDFSSCRLNFACRLYPEAFKLPQSLFKISDVFFTPRARTPLVVTDSCGWRKIISLK